MSLYIEWYQEKFPPFLIPILRPCRGSIFFLRLPRVPALERLHTGLNAYTAAAVEEKYSVT
jgi:hypothetical protein